jgi:hypothetical protein
VGGRGYQEGGGGFKYSPKNRKFLALKILTNFAFFIKLYCDTVLVLKYMLIKLEYEISFEKEFHFNFF